MPPVWGWLPQGPFMPHCSYCSPGSPACWLYRHWDMLEPNQLPRVANVLVFQDHFMKHVSAYVTPDQAAKTIAKFLYWGYISISGALARLLSDRGASFMSSMIEEMCKILGIKWLWTIPYHPQTNGLVERLTRWLCKWLGSWQKKKSQLAISFGWNSACL